MGENKYDVFDDNINEIKELSEKLKEPLEEPINILYYDIEKKRKLNIKEDIQIKSVKEKGYHIMNKVKLYILDIF